MNISTVECFLPSMSKLLFTIRQTEVKVLIPTSIGFLPAKNVKWKAKLD